MKLCYVKFILENIPSSRTVGGSNVVLLDLEFQASFLVYPFNKCWNFGVNP